MTINGPSRRPDDERPRPPADDDEAPVRLSGNGPPSSLYPHPAPPGQVPRPTSPQPGQVPPPGQPIYRPGERSGYVQPGQPGYGQPGPPAQPGQPGPGQAGQQGQSGYRPPGQGQAGYPPPGQQPGQQPGQPGHPGHPAQPGHPGQHPPPGQPVHPGQQPGQQPGQPGWPAHPGGGAAQAMPRPGAQAQPGTIGHSAAVARAAVAPPAVPQQAVPQQAAPQQRAAPQPAAPQPAAPQQRGAPQPAVPQQAAPQHGAAPPAVGRPGTAQPGVGPAQAAPVQHAGATVQQPARLAPGQQQARTAPSQGQEATQQAGVDTASTSRIGAPAVVGNRAAEAAAQAAGAAQAAAATSATAYAAPAAAPTPVRPVRTPPASPPHGTIYGGTGASGVNGNGRLRSRNLLGLRVGAHTASDGALALLGMRMPGAGMVLGYDLDNATASIRLFRPEPTRVALVGGEWAVHVLTLRALGLGARVAVFTATPERWEGFGEWATGRAGRVATFQPNQAVIVPASAREPALLLYDVGLTGAPSTSPLGPWQTRLTVLRQLTTYGVSTLQESSVIMTQRLTKAETDLITQTMRLSSEAGGWMQTLSDDALAVLIGGEERFVRLTIADVEKQLGVPHR
jgi:hypothetical protein